MKARWYKHRLQFYRPAQTSRGALQSKLSYFLLIEHDNGRIGMGECSLLPGLSPDDPAQIERWLSRVCTQIDSFHADDSCLQAFPALRFALESAMLLPSAQGVCFENGFTLQQQPLPINGLIWMADKTAMQRQIEAKLAQGYDCIKLKIGALDFAQELQLLRELRQQYSAEQLEIRVDANGAFHPAQALQKLARLAELELHSIEQPIAAGQWPQLAELVAHSPLAIALDEELIGLTWEQQRALLITVKPDYVVLKPSLLGGLEASRQWIALAEAHGVGWWLTSALESNLGLSLLAQWVASLAPAMPQGLGTGRLYTNNLPSALTLQAGKLYYSAGSDYLQQLWGFFHGTGATVK